MIRVTLEIRGFDDVDYVRNEFMKNMKVFSDNVKVSVEKVYELTEVEKVILENIGEDCVSLMRNNGSLYFHTEGKGIFPNLFQFIKERRRIYDRRIIRR